MALIKAALLRVRRPGWSPATRASTPRAGPKGVGDAVNQAVVITFVLLFFVNFILTALYFNFVPQKV